MDKGKIIFSLWVLLLIATAVWIPNRARITAIRQSAQEESAQEVKGLVIVSSTLLSCQTHTDCASDALESYECSAVPACVNELCVVECPAGEIEGE